MSASARWIFRLADSAAMRNITGVSPISPMWDPSLSLVYNRPGQFTATLPIDSSFALAAQKHRTCIIAERNGRARWSGPITGITDEVSADQSSQDTTKITATGWFNELNKRYIQPSDEQFLVFSSGNDTAGAIIFALLGRMATRADSTGTVAPVRITPGLRTDTQTRIRSYKRSTTYGAAITELVDIENGVDISVDPLSRQLSVRGAEEFVDRKRVHFIAPGMDNANLIRCSNIEDGEQTANSLTVTGTGSTRIIVDDHDEILRLGVLLEQEIALGDVSNANILGAYANAELVYRLHGANQLSVLPNTLPSEGNVYRLFDHFDLGDMMYLSANRGRMQFRRQPMRAFAATVNVDTEGNEIISEIQTTVQ